MKTNKLRSIIPLVSIVIIGLAFVGHLEVGTLSAIGWRDIALLCPIGALGTMLASKTIVPRAVISLVLAVVGIVLVGRAFCGWICPVPVWGKLRSLTNKQQSDAEVQEVLEQRIANTTTPLTDKEIERLRQGCGRRACHAEGSNSRFFVLGGALLSAAIFGFPVFCLICPVGLSFAGIFTLIMLFSEGNVNLSVVAIPVILLLETVVFRKWCSHICPISAFMSLFSRFNRTLRPTIDDAKCIETGKGATCGRCTEVCEAGIDPRHPQLGANMLECTKCRACVESCPGKAITMPLLPKTKHEQPRNPKRNTPKTEAQQGEMVAIGKAGD